jgi:flagellar basal body-associated protein FliL
MVVKPAEVQAVAKPRRRQRRWVSLLIVLVIVLGVLGAAAGLYWALYL